MIVFNYGVMGCGKSTELVKTYDQLQRKGENVVIAKPTTDVRDGEYLGWGFTGSRITKDKKPAFYFDTIQEVFDKVSFSILLLDEVQFMLENDIMKLTDLKQDVIAYGLKSDINAKLFPASAKLLAIADSVKEIPALCENKGCKNKAQVHSRYINNRLDKSGISTMIENGIVNYKSLCINSWKKERE